MSKSMIIILMGSKSDLQHCQKIAKAAEFFGIECKMHIASAHKTPGLALEILNGYENDPVSKVYITVAGRSNALSGFSDGVVASPVIACPPVSSSFGGGDIYSSLRMPSGIAPGVVLEPANAALFAAKILGLQDEAVRAKVREYQKMQQDKIITDNQELQQ